MTNKEHHASDYRILHELAVIKDKEAIYLVGLKPLLHQLARKNVRDFNTIAHELTSLRRQFLEDTSTGFILDCSADREQIYEDIAFDKEYYSGLLQEYYLNLSTSTRRRSEDTLWITL